MRVGVVRFLGTNCDYDIAQMVQMKGHQSVWLWHQDRFSKDDVDMVILPGGFSYGDYLRTGALAARTSVMDSVREFATYGGPVLGICNGFQILTESRLLPGALVRNNHLEFRDQWVSLKRAFSCSHFAKESKGEIDLPVAHGDGRFYAPVDELKRIWDQEQVWWTYQEDINGSLDQIAGVMNDKKNIAALMPHPERALFDWMGGIDGWGFLP